MRCVFETWSLSSHLALNEPMAARDSPELRVSFACRPVCSGDTNGNGIADFEIKVTGIGAGAAGDFGL